jgi:hypothetical protein
MLQIKVQVVSVNSELVRKERALINSHPLIELAPFTLHRSVTEHAPGKRTKGIAAIPE